MKFTIEDSKKAVSSMYCSAICLDLQTWSKSISKKKDLYAGDG